MRTSQTIFLSIIDIEDRCPWLALFCKVLHELHQRDNTYSIIRHSRSRRNRVKVRRTVQPSTFLGQMLNEWTRVRTTEHLPCLETQALNHLL